MNETAQEVTFKVCLAIFHQIFATNLSWSHLQTLLKEIHNASIEFVFNWQVVDTVYGELGKHDKVSIGIVPLTIWHMFICIL